MDSFIKKNVIENLKINIFQMVMIAVSVTFFISILMLKSTVLNRLNNVSEQMKQNYSASFLSSESYDEDTYEKIRNIDTVKDVIPFIAYDAELHIGGKVRYFLFSGAQPQDLENKAVIITEGRNVTQGSREILISEKVALKDNIKVGDTVQLVINNEITTLTVVGLYKKTMHQIAAYYEMYGDADFVRNVYGENAMYNSMMISMTDTSPDNMSNVLTKIHSYIPGAEFENVYDLQNASARDYNSFSMLLWSILAIFILLSIYLIYSFTIIKTEQAVSTILTMKMLGAKDQFVKKVYFKENVLVGIAGIIIGIILAPAGGLLLSYFYANGDIADIRPYFISKLSFAVIGGLIGILIPLFATFISLKGLSGDSLISMMRKNVSSEVRQISTRKKTISFMMGVILIIGIYLCANMFVYIADDILIYALMVTSGAILVVAVFLITPLITDILCVLLDRICSDNSMSFFLAIKNTVSGNNNAQKIIAFVSISVMIVSALMGTFSSAEKSVGLYVDTAYAHDYIIDIPEASIENCTKIVKEINNSSVSAGCTWLPVYNYNQNDKKFRIFAIDTEYYDKFCNLKIIGADSFSVLEKGNCYISKQIAIDNHYKIGDIIQIPYKEKMLHLKIQGIFSSIVNDGRLIFADRDEILDLIKDDFDAIVFANKLENVDFDIYERTIAEKCSFTELDFLRVADYKVSWINSIFNGTEIFYVLFVIISFLVLLMVIGNYLTSVRKRKKDIAILYAIGSNSRLINKEFVMETLIIVILSTIVGLIGSFSLLSVFVKSFSAIFNADLTVFFPWKISMSVLGFFIFVLVIVNMVIIRKVGGEDKNRYIKTHMM